MRNGLITGVVGYTLKCIAFYILYFSQTVKGAVAYGNNQVSRERCFDRYDLPVLPKIEENIINNFLRKFTAMDKPFGKIAQGFVGFFEDLLECAFVISLCNKQKQIIKTTSFQRALVGRKSL